MAELVGAAIISAFSAAGVGTVAAGASGAVVGTVIGGTFLSAGLVGGVVITGALTAAQYIMQQQQTDKAKRALSQASAFGQANPEIKATIRQAIPTQRLIYGRCYVGGAMFFYEVKPPFLYVGLLVAAHEIDAVEQIRIGTTPVQFGLTGAAATPPWFTGANTYLYQSTRFGTSGQAIDTILAADFPSLPATFRQRGHATVVFKAHFGDSADHHKTLWGDNGQFEPYLIVRGAKVYDPRDPTQISTDPSTWKWSRNASLCIADYLTRSAGGRIPSSQIRWDKVAESASRDDELIGVDADGTFIPRHTLDGVVTLDQPPNRVLETMLTSNRGFIVQSDGRVHVSSGRPQSPVMTIHENMLAGPLEFRSAKSRRDMANVVRTEFVSPDRAYQQVNGPVLTRSDLIASDGQRLEVTLPLPFTSHQAAAQRLAKAYLDTSRLGRSLTLRLALEAAQLDAGDVVRVELQLLPQVNGLYQVQKAEFTDGFSAVAVTLAEYDPLIENDWVPSRDENTFTISPASL